MPDRFHLMGDANAFVAPVGGWMGFFARPVMGVGLPLLQGLSTSELASVLAHEFGHFQRGDTRHLVVVRIQVTAVGQHAPSDQAKAVAPVEIKENFNRLVILALEDFAARRRRKSFEEAMDQMGSDQEIRKECRAINRDFQKAEGDGLSDGD